MGFTLGLYWDNGKENGSYYLGFMLGLYKENGKEHANYGDYRGYIGIIEGIYLAI